MAKRSPGKSTVGGRKWAWRVREPRTPAVFDGHPPRYDRPVWVDVITTTPEPPSGEARPLQLRVVDGGRVVDATTLEEARRFHAEARTEFPDGEPLLSYRLSPSGPTA